MVDSIDLIKRLSAKKGKSKNIFDGMNFDLTKTKKK
jgi:hypothetical protein